MSTVATQTASAETSVPTSDAWLLIVQIKPGRVDALRAEVGAELEALADPNSALSQMFNQVGTVHFARAAIIDGDRFLFASHFDGDGQAYLDDFFTLSGNGQLFDLAFRYCEDWPGPEIATDSCSSGTPTGSRTSGCFAPTREPPAKRSRNRSASAATWRRF